MDAVPQETSLLVQSSPPDDLRGIDPRYRVRSSLCQVMRDQWMGSTRDQRE